MQKFSISLIALVLLSCDVFECGSCYPGAPELRVEFFFSAESDSSYLKIDDWQIFDDDSKIRLRYPKDSVIWDYSIPFMDVSKTDSSIQFAGTGVIWDHLDDLNAELAFDFGNNDVDTLGVKIGVINDGCCEAHTIDGVSYNGVGVQTRIGYFYKVRLAKN